MKEIYSDSATIDALILPKMPKLIPLQWVENDESVIQSFKNFFGDFSIGVVTADLSQITNLQDYIETVAKAHIGNKVVINFTKSGVDAIASLAIIGYGDGYKAMVSSLPGAAASFTTEAALITAGASSGIAGLAAFAIGSIVQNQYDDWKSFEDNKKANIDNANQANSSGQLEINSYTEDFDTIKKGLNLSGFLDLINDETQIIVTTPSGKAFEVIKGSNFTQIANELESRGFPELNDPLQDSYDGIKELFVTNPWLKERFSDGAYNELATEHPYFLLEQNEKALFPMIGNIYNNRIYADDFSRILY